MKTIWYRYIGAGGHSGPARKTWEEASDAWDKAMIRKGYDASSLGTADAAGSCRMAAGTTKSAVEDADVSEYSGRNAHGKWVQPVNSEDEATEALKD